MKRIDKRLIERDSINLRVILNEISTMRDLSHPNIVPLYSIYENERHVYLVMKLIEHETVPNSIINGSIYSER